MIETNFVFLSFALLKEGAARLKCMMMTNCFLQMVDQRKALSLVSSREHRQRYSPSQISDTPRNRIWTCAEPKFRLCWMKLCISGNHQGATFEHLKIEIFYFSNIFSYLQSETKSSPKFLERVISIFLVSNFVVSYRNRSNDTGQRVLVTGLEWFWVIKLHIVYPAYPLSAWRHWHLLHFREVASKQGLTFFRGKVADFTYQKFWMTKKKNKNVFHCQLRI